LRRLRRPKLPALRRRFPARLGYQAWTGFALLAALTAISLGPLRAALEPDFVVAQLQQYGSLSVLLFPLAYAVLTVAGVPGIALTIGSGVVYGSVGGTLLSLLGATLGALAAFGLARYVLPERALQR